MYIAPGYGFFKTDMTEFVERGNGSEEGISRTSDNPSTVVLSGNLQKFSSLTPNAITMETMSHSFQDIENKTNNDKRNNPNNTKRHNMNSKVNKQLNKLPENLRLNGRTPSGKRRLFVCQVCTRAFARQEHLTRHERSHTKEKPYCCGICNRKFSRRDLLLRHAHKIHGGSYGDTIVKENSDKRVGKRRRCDSVTATNAVHAANSAMIGEMVPKASFSSPVVTVKGKRRASYSAQSGNYVAPAPHEQWHKADRVKFSTPELLPIDMTDDVLASSTSNDGKKALKFDESSNADNFWENIAPLDLNVSDTSGWIQEYNNHNTTTSGSTTTEGEPTPGDSPKNVEGGVGTDNCNSKSRKSSWIDNREDGELQVKSLFVNRNNSVPPPRSFSNNSKMFDLSGKLLANSNASSIGPTDDTNLTKTTTTATMDDDCFSLVNHAGSVSSSIAPLQTIGANSNTNTGALSEQLTRLQFDESGEGDITDFAKDVQSIFGRFIQDEQSDIYSIPHQFPVPSGDDGENLINPPMEPEVNHAFTDPNDNYTFYGLDYLTLSNISRASPPNDDIEDLPPSKLFTHELRQMCLQSLRYYNKHCNGTGGGTLESDPVFISKDLIVPSCSELNGYLSHFQKYFCPHTAFIHPDFFQLDLSPLKAYINENDTVDEEDFQYLQYSNVACLPLFAATVGSIYKPGCSSRTMELYEISRRVLHVYLERRKQQHQGKHSFISKYPSKVCYEDRQRIWLVQSLILSITFALFADYLERMDSEMIKRQVSAICSIIKGNFLKIVAADSHEFSSTYKDMAFNNSCDYIFFESKIRCTLTVYEICQFLKIFYRVGSGMFLNEGDLDPVCIPDDECSWLNSSLLSPINSPKKKYTANFQRFYHSFTFNNIGMHPIPESLSSTMLYYEFNASNLSSFHVFLTRIDTKKLEHNHTQPLQSDLKNLAIPNFLNSDSVILKNCLMSMVFLTKIDVAFGSKIWNGELWQLFVSFLDPSSFNTLTKGSYSLLTDFLVALNFSIKNVAHFLTLNETGTAIELHKENMSLFRCQGFYCNFLILIKFILDFEFTPNFKLLCIFTELKKLANNLFIPKYSNLYPIEFAKFHDVSITNSYLQNHPASDQSARFSTINVAKLENLINNVLVYAFNDASFLNMSEQPTNEFFFNNNHPTYYPYASQNSAATFNTEEANFRASLSSPLNDNDFLPSKSSVDLLHFQSDNNNQTGSSVGDKGFGSGTSSNNGKNNVARQGFAERYQLSDKYITIAKCFFMHVSESYAHCHIFKKMVSDFQQLEECVNEKRQRTKMFKMNQDDGSNATMIKNQSSADLINKFLQTQG